MKNLSKVSTKMLIETLDVLTNMHYRYMTVMDRQLMFNIKHELKNRGQVIPKSFNAQGDADFISSTIGQIKTGRV